VALPRADGDYQVSQYILYSLYFSMSWEVEFTDEFGVWWDTLADGAQDAVDRIVGLLEARGPQLGHQQTWTRFDVRDYSDDWTPEVQ
jgi:hypothetical protein